MDSIRIENFIKVLKEKNISLFTLDDVSKFFNVSLPNLKKSLGRFINKGIVSRLAKNRYLFQLATEPPSQYKMANFIYQPSYISLETAMSLNGTIDQFPYSITSVTCRKSKEIVYKDLVFNFTHVNKDLFIDYQKQNDYLIASDQKAIFDYFYLVFKNSRSKNNLGLINLDKNGIKKLIRYIKCQKMKNKHKFISYVKNNYDN